MKTMLPHLRTFALLTANLFAVHLASAQNIWNATNGVSAETNWSTAANWSLGTIPSSADSVQFLDNGTTAGAPGTIDNVADYSTNIANLWYGNTNGFHTTFIADGQTLTINGGGIPGIQNNTVLSASRDDYTTSNQTIYTTITGLNATLNVTNPAGRIQVRMGSNTNPPATKATLDMSGLGTLNADLLTMNAGVESALPRGCSGFIFLARTNVVVLLGSGFDANFSSGNPGLYIGHNTSAGLFNVNGSAIYLGITNAIFVDYAVIGRGNQTNCFFGFNPAFSASNPYAYIRGTNGGSARVGAYKVGDNSAGSQTNPDSATNDFTGGTVDAMIDNLFVGFSRSSGVNSNQGVGTLTFNAGTIDANRVTLGYNTNELCTAVGAMNVNGGKLVANNMIQLAQVPPAATGPVAALTTRTLNIRGGAQVFANTITNSGGIGRIAITNGSLLVTNFIGITGFPVNFLALSNATLTLPSYPSPTPAALVTNLAVGGTTNKINVSSIGAILSYPAQLVMIKYSGTLSGTFNIGLGTLPTSPGTPFAGFISNNTVNSSVDLVLTSGPISRTLTWEGLNGVNLDSTWDVGTTPTWQTNGVATTFDQLDFARFDDTGSTNVVDLTTALFPGGVTVSNSSVNYTLTDFGSGLGPLSGSGNFIKQGNGTLVIDNTGVNNAIGSMSISNGSTVQIGNNDAAGSLPVSGQVINNGSLIFYRTDSSAAGNLISGSGSISNATGSLTLRGANTFTGPVTVASGATLVAGNSLALGNPTNGSATIYNGASAGLFLPTRTWSSV
jgi:autotransporter-associated beta strand protein